MRENTKENLNQGYIRRFNSKYSTVQEGLVVFPASCLHSFVTNLAGNASDLTWVGKLLANNAIGIACTIALL